MGFIPTPSNLPPNITANPNAGIFERLGSSFLRQGPPLISGPYNIANTFAHLAQGTAGQHGPAPSFLGKILQLFNPTFSQGGGNISPQTPGGPGGAMPIGPGAFAGDPTDPNNPGAYQLGGAGGGMAPGAAAAAGGGLGRGWKEVFDTGRFPGGPAFAATLPQFMFPGSPIGPTTGLVTNPYDPSSPLAKAGAQDTSIPGFAKLYMDWVRTRNQI